MSEALPTEATISCHIFKKDQRDELNSLLHMSMLDYSLDKFLKNYNDKNETAVENLVTHEEPSDLDNVQKKVNQLENLLESFRDNGTKEFLRLNPKTMSLKRQTSKVCMIFEWYDVPSDGQFESDTKAVRHIGTLSDLKIPNHNLDKFSQLQWD